MRKTVPVSPMVAKALLEKGMSADDILRKALGVTVGGMAAAPGVIFPEGTALMTWYKDRPYWGHVRDGAIEMMGERFPSVSAAAVRITNRPMNGWDFWEAKLPGTRDFVRISTLRPVSKRKH